MGNKYYMQIRAEYTNPESVIAKLTPTNPSDERDHSLVAALEAFVETKACIQQYVDWAGTVANVNNFNLIAVYRQALSMPPQKSLENTIFGIMTLKLVRRLELHRTFPQPWALMREYFDKCLQGSLHQYKLQGKQLTFWWKTNRECASLILPVVAVDKTMQCEGSWSDVCDEVEAIFNSSEIGRILMDKAMRQVSMERVSKVICDFVEKVKVDDQPITAKMLEQNREEFIKEMTSRCVDVSKPDDAPKEIDCQYRGVCTKVVCVSPAALVLVVVVASHFCYD